MAFKSKTAGTKIVLLNLLQCLLVFYTLYYMIGSVCFGAFRLNSFDGLIPFDFKTQAAKSNSKYLVNLLSMELTYFTSGILFAIIVKKWVWDYSITVTLIHVILSSAVMTEFPLVWQWWLALGGGLLMMICNGQLVAHFACQNNPAYSSNNL
ncbi:putative transmembrane protein 244 isoform X1 [Hemiscyllium ocellatum]|uniref:putative transmembrane protein 244 isoform X1 n=1 Tax=Hemiscyllium ocellatum TaxID=170820 RepID=UPI0029671142|nr:putative transmembrane protein 244 isoform X1 [Hemiscyllium ocellatum]